MSGSSVDPVLDLELVAPTRRSRARSVLDVVAAMFRPGARAREYLLERCGLRRGQFGSLPWLSWGAIDRLETMDLVGTRVLELGAGASTLYLLNRGALVTSFETDPGWAAKVKGAACSRSLGMGRLDMRIYEETWTTKRAFERSRFRRDAVAESATADLILCDFYDHYLGYPLRASMVAAIEPAMTRSATLVLDDSWRYESVFESLQWASVERYRGLGPNRRAVTETAVLVK